MAGFQTPPIQSFSKGELPATAGFRHQAPCVNVTKETLSSDVQYLCSLSRIQNEGVGCTNQIRGVRDAPHGTWLTCEDLERLTQVVTLKDI